jgi:pilus assembly protein CpaF
MTLVNLPLWPTLQSTRLPAGVRRALGPLAEFVDDPRVTDVFVLGHGLVHVDTGDGVYPVQGFQLSKDQALELARGLIELGGRHIDEATPMADVTIAPGVRVHVVLPPISTMGPLVSIRVASKTNPAVDELDLEDAERVIPALIRIIRARRSVLISGATGSGKTTLLAALMAHADPTERLVVLEDVAEIQIDHPHVVTLESRQSTIEGTGEIGLERLVRESLRMRPNRLIIGECRGAEIAQMLQAFHTGHRGGATTVHAHSVGDVPIRLDALGALAGMTPGALARQAAGAFDLVIHVDKTSTSTRTLSFGTLVLSPEGVLDHEPVGIDSL